MIAGKEFELGKSEEEDKELLKLKKIIEKENGHHT
jgi:hypothetical protein